VRYPGSAACTAIQNETPPSPLPSDSAAVSASLQVTFQTGGAPTVTNPTEVAGYMEALRIPMALYTAGCTDEALALLAMMRRLSSGETITYATADAFQTGKWLFC